MLNEQAAQRGSLSSLGDDNDYSRIPAYLHREKV
jgi:hypothetical protein